MKTNETSRTHTFMPGDRVRVSYASSEARKVQFQYHADRCGVITGKLLPRFVDQTHRNYAVRLNGVGHNETLEVVLPDYCLEPDTTSYEPYEVDPEDPIIPAQDGAETTEPLPGSRTRP